MTYKKKLYLILGLSILTLGLFGVSYALFMGSSTQTSLNEITTLSCLNTTITDASSGINLTNEYPIQNTEGMEKTPYTFTLTNNCTNYVRINIALESLTTTTLPANLVEVSLNKTGKTGNKGSLLGSFPVGESLNGGMGYVLMSTDLYPNESQTYDLRIWLDYSATNAEANKIFNGKVIITETVQSTPTEPNVPLLADNMVPVYYDETNDVWKKADSTNPSGTNNWYDYRNQKWANAVTVTSGTRTTYNSSAVGTTISMDDIVGMWVWIPRFEYKIDNPGLSTTAEEIHINYISGIDTTNTTNYLIHPAFRNGTVYKNTTDYDLGGWDKELTGFWYGKFETGYASNLTSTTAAISTGILIKPDVYGMDYQTVSNEYTTAQNVQTDHGIGSQIETHMSKNDEWGAVTYLSNSKYGKYGNSDYSGPNKEVFINNAYTYTGDKYTTGRSNGIYAGGTGSTSKQNGTYEYNNCPASSATKTACDLSTRQTNATKGTGASTTGNIYGVYDMVGGLNEYVMGNYANTIESSGFSTMPNQKYYNKYTSTELSTACNGVACPGLGWSNEIGNNTTDGQNNWYNDLINLPYTSCPWVYRGCFAPYSDNTGGGLFYSSYNVGFAYNNSGFRVVGA